MMAFLLWTCWTVLLVVCSAVAGAVIAFGDCEEDPTT